MLSDFRKALKSTPVQLMIWMSVASIAGGGSIVLLISRYFSGSPDTVATVNGQDISYREFSRKVSEIQQLVQQIKQTQGVDADEVLKMWGLEGRPHKLVLEGLVGEKVMKSAGQSLGAQVHPEYLQKKLTDTYFVYQHLKDLVPPEALRSGSLDVHALKASLARNGIAEREFDDLLQDALLRELLFALIQAGLYLPDEVVKDAYIGAEVKKKYAYVPLARSQYERKARETKLTEPEIEGYYSKKDNQEAYRIVEKRSATVWTFTPDTFGLALSDDEIKTAYNRSRSSYLKKPEELRVQHILFTYTDDTKTEVRAQAQEVYNSLKEAPASFSEVAAEKSASTDKASTITVTRSGSNPTVASIAFGLEEGAISPVRETSEGYEIIKLIERVKPEYKPLDEVKNEVVAKLRKEKFDRLFTANAQRVVSQARQAPAFLTKFIDQHKGQVSTVTDIVPSDSPQSKRIFKLQRIGDYGFYQDGNKGYIVELTAITPSKVPALAQVKQKVVDDIYKKRAEELLAADLEKAVDEVRTGKKTLAQVAQLLGATVDITDWISFNDKESLLKLEKMNISLPEVQHLTKQGAVVTDLTDTHGYIIQVKQIDTVKPEAYEKKKDRQRAMLARQQGQLLSAEFIQALKDQAAISYNEQLLKQLR